MSRINPSRGWAYIIVGLFFTWFSGVALLGATSVGGLPLTFEENRGQAEAAVRFLAHGKGYAVKVTSDGAIVALQRPGTTDRRSQVTIRLEKGNPRPIVAPSLPLPGKVSYCLGANPAQWKLAIPTYGAVTLHEVYPGIDWVFYGNQNQLEYDFMVRPGADPAQIVLAFDGALKVEEDAAGGLIIHTPGGDAVQRRPVVYQGADRRRQAVAGSSELLGGGRIGFRVAAYDLAAPLTIDPTLVYSTFFGSTNPVFDAGKAIAVDASNNVYIAGNTLIVPGGAVFVSKFNPAANALIYSFALGGTRGQSAMGIAVDTNGNACVVGTTSSPDFPTKNPLPNAFADLTDYFLMKINPQGTDFVFSTFLGSVGSGLGPTAARGGVAVDPGGNVYAAGTTASPDFPVSANAFQKALRNDSHDSFLRSDAFATKLSPTGKLIYSTYLGGNGTDAGNAVAVDASGAAYITGSTLSIDYPTTGNALYNGVGLSAAQAFVTKLLPDGSGLVYSTYLRGASDGRGIALDSQGNAYVAGFTGGFGLPTTTNAYQSNPSGNGTHDAYLLKLNAAGDSVAYATYLGGDGADEGMAVAATPDGFTALTGFTGFTGTRQYFPTTNSMQAYAGNNDAFVAKFDPVGNIIYSTYLGGSQNDTGNG